jgi:signal transduction histidine kinase
MISRLESYGAYELYWLIEDPNFFAYTGSIQTLVWGLFGGILLTLFIYNMSMFVHLRDKAFLVYSLHVLITFWYQYAINGIIYQYFHSINLNFITISVWVAPYLAQTFVFLFAYYFFKLNGSKIGKWILFSAWVSFFISMFYLTSLLDMNRLFLAKYITLPSLLFALFLIFFSIYMVFKRYAGSLYFFLGQGIFILCNIYNISIISANMQPSEFSWMVMPIGIVFDLIFLSLALGQRIHKIKKENENSERIIFEQARFSSIGQTIGSITHQWRLPISQLSSQVMFLTATFKHNKENFLDEFEKTAPKISDTIDYMQENINMFHDFYKSANQKISFNPKKEIDTILKILDDKIVLGNITVDIDIDEREIFCYKSAFSNIAMIIVENSIEAFEGKVGNKKIKISIASKVDKTILIVSDNAGGIDSKILKNIFISNQTTKPEQGCGFGLPIAKNLAQKQLGGKISVENLKDGTIFKVVF